MLINTVPLDMFVKSCNSMPEAVVSVTEDLVHNGGLIVGLGLKGAE